MAVVQELTDIVSAAPHDLEPATRDRTQFAWALLHPCVDGWISFHGTWKRQDTAHCPRLHAGGARLFS
jgi:hypothetical protein